MVILTLENTIEKALVNGYKLPLDATFFAVGSELVQLFDKDEEFIRSVDYMAIIFRPAFAKAIWGTEKYMAYYSGYNEWADATTPEEEYADSDEIQHSRMPLWEYHLMMMARAEDRLKYLSENA